ncbi:hypothetical protein NLG97_g11188 [Lecanicillium saksenae]|uniref:Uncharacterized protein n=1 Tax=Lecanicillium saksenae TaxID=468837 RepID=A0ACC1QCX0_9HYPO|nr:hypothetical protein NLG97_g11188 [Lecanicillium saksenae]
MEEAEAKVQTMRRMAISGIGIEGLSLYARNDAAAVPRSLWMAHPIAMDDDERMEDAEATREPQLALSEDERQILELYDKLQHVQLEIAIINAHKSQQSAPADDSPEAQDAAQEALLQARSRYKLRNDAVELIMMANPVLKAVHGGTTASPIDRYAATMPHPILSTVLFLCL